MKRLGVKKNRMVNKTNLDQNQIHRGQNNRLCPPPHQYKWLQGWGQRCQETHKKSHHREGIPRILGRKQKKKKSNFELEDHSLQPIVHKRSQAPLGGERWKKS